MVKGRGRKGASPEMGGLVAVLRTSGQPEGEASQKDKAEETERPEDERGGRWGGAGDRRLVGGEKCGGLGGGRLGGLLEG